MRNIILMVLLLTLGCEKTVTNTVEVKDNDCYVLIEVQYENASNALKNNLTIICGDGKEYTVQSGYYCSFYILRDTVELNWLAHNEKIYPENHHFYNIFMDGEIVVNQR